MKDKFQSAPSRSSLLFMMVLLIALGHGTSHPLEQKLGLAHTKVVFTPSEALLVSCFGSVKFLCLFALTCLVSFRATLWLHRKIRAAESPKQAMAFGRFRLLILTVSSALMVQTALGFQALILSSSLLLLIWSIQVSHQRPNPQVLALTLFVHNVLRLCIGLAWLIELLALEASKPGPLSLLLGGGGLLAVSYGVFQTGPAQPWRRFAKTERELRSLHRFSRRLGTWEMVVVLACFTLTSSASNSLTATFLQMSNTLIWSRGLVLLLESQTEINQNRIYEFRFRENIFRIGSMVWLSLPAILWLWDFPLSYEWLTVWLLVQSALIVPGMPWRGRRAQESWPEEPLSNLQKAALVWSAYEWHTSETLVEFLKPRLLRSLRTEAPKLITLPPDAKIEFFRKLWLAGFGEEFQYHDKRADECLAKLLSQEPKNSASLITQLSKGFLCGC